MKDRKIDPVSPSSGLTTTTRDVIIRSHRIGDMGTVISSHGVLYQREYGFDITFEALVARIAADFIESFDPNRYCSRIADCDGSVVGSAFVVPAAKDDAATAKLRLVYLEPHVRGSGLARLLVEDCLTFAREAGYTRMTLWTQDILIAARRLYARLGFRCVETNPFTGFGQMMVNNEIWVRDL